MIGGDSSGSSLYLDAHVPTFCYNHPGPEYTYIPASEALAPGRHEIGYTSVDFDSRPDLQPAHDDHHAAARVTHAMIRQ